MFRDAGRSEYAETSIGPGTHAEGQDGGVYNGNCRMERQTESRTRHPLQEGDPLQPPHQQAKENAGKEKTRQAG
ncbi:hypothetical protein GXP70_08215 [Paenibacillus lycopersici]|uniref:Uncharacterized protein n=1 Tax=Paenibacillus lycopersici TaxID=2704462 RepID=A0A6C0FS28_9BACL|nr:hypothetical protein [Paenibacillus lycopersici]QHT59938.1 hypothetical protein GXP70_08215 [Paenibacillus lycopersici]